MYIYIHIYVYRMNQAYVLDVCTHIRVYVCCVMLQKVVYHEIYRTHTQGSICISTPRWGGIPIYASTYAHMSKPQWAVHVTICIHTHTRIYTNTHIIHKEAHIYLRHSGLHTLTAREYNPCTYSYTLATTNSEYTQV
jgi:hypothetical protein